MKIEKNQVVTIFHFSEVKPFKSIVVDFSEDEIVLKLVEAFLTFKFTEDDNVVLGMETEGTVYMANCRISRIIPGDGIIKFKVTGIRTFEEQRRHERFFVSFPAEIFTDNPYYMEEQYGVIIEDLSLSGLKIISGYELNNSRKYNIGMAVGADEIILRVEIVRMDVMGNKFEYGLKITGKGPYDGEIFNSFVNSIKEEQAKIIKELIRS